MSERRTRSLISWIEAAILPLQEHVNVMERRPAVFVPLPALAQQVVDLTRAQRRSVEMDGRRRRRLVGIVAAAAAAAVPSITVLDDFVVGHRRERHLATECQDLPHRDAERPHVALC